MEEVYKVIKSENLPKLKELLSEFRTIKFVSRNINKRISERQESISHLIFRRNLFDIGRFIFQMFGTSIKLLTHDKFGKLPTDYISDVDSKMTILVEKYLKQMDEFIKKSNPVSPPLEVFQGKKRRLLHIGRRKVFSRRKMSSEKFRGLLLSQNVVDQKIEKYSHIFLMSVRDGNFKRTRMILVKRKGFVNDNAVKKAIHHCVMKSDSMNLSVILRSFFHGRNNKLNLQRKVAYLKDNGKSKVEVKLIDAARKRGNKEILNLLKEFGRGGFDYSKVVEDKKGIKTYPESFRRLILV